MRTFSSSSVAPPPLVSMDYWAPELMEVPARNSYRNLFYKENIFINADKSTCGADVDKVRHERPGTPVGS